MTLFIKSLQHGTIVKPKSANGCYHGDEGTFFWAISGKIGESELLPGIYFPTCIRVSYIQLYIQLLVLVDRTLDGFYNNIISFERFTLMKCVFASRNQYYLITIPGDDLYLNITATIKETEWVAVGFSNDTLMGYDDIVAVYKDSYTQSFIAAPLFDPHGTDIV